VLALLSEAPGRTLRMSALAALAEGSLPRLSQVVARLEQRGWIRRIPDPADGRYTLARSRGRRLPPNAAGRRASRPSQSCPRGKTPAALDMLSIEAIGAPWRCPRTTPP
jgi:hypothetical protein